LGGQQPSGVKPLRESQQQGAGALQVSQVLQVLQVLEFSVPTLLLLTSDGPRLQPDFFFFVRHAVCYLWRGMPAWWLVCADFLFLFCLEGEPPAKPLRREK